MRNTRKSLDRALALLLSVIMVVAMMPVSMLTAFAATTEYPDSFTVSVKDTQGNPVEGAQVVFGNGDTEWSIYLTAQTDANGIAVFDSNEIKAAFEAGVTAGTITSEYVLGNVTATKSGYVLVSNEVVSIYADAGYTEHVDLTMTPPITDVEITGNNLTYNGAAQELVSVTAKEGDTVEYSVDGGAATTATVPTATDVCSKSITVTVTRGGYTTLSKTVTGAIVAAEITGVTVEETNNTYNGSELPLVNVSGVQAGDNVTYKVNDGAETTELPKATNAGSYNVTVTVNRGINYKVFEKTVNSKIEPGTLDLGSLRIEGLEGVYTGEAQNAVSVTGKGDYSLQYKLDGGEWSDTIPTVTDAGSYTVEVKATKTNYNDKDVTVDPAASAVIPFNVYVAKADQTGFDFVEKNVADLPYNGTFDNAATGGQSGGTITYEVVEGEEYVSVDQNGKVTALKAGGTATVKATLAGNDNYNEASATYVIETKKADQSGFAFENTEYKVKYGVKNLIVVAVGGQSGGAVTYEIVSGDLGTIVSADNKGTITFVTGKKCEMTVKATLNGGENYNDITAEAKVKVETNNFSDKVNRPASGWHTENVIITPAEGYKISTSGGFDATWSESITVATEGKNVVGNVFVKDKSGYISEAIAVDDIYIDKTNPTGLGISYSRPVVDKTLEGILFGFYNAKMTVTLTATDLVSKIDHFVYKIGDGTEVTINKDNITYSGENGEIATASFDIDPDLSRSKISFVAFDTAGRSSDVVGNKTLIVDETEPTISVSYDNNDANNEHYFDSDRTVTITIKEENFFKDNLYDLIPDTDKQYLTITVGKRGDGETVYTDTVIKPEFVKDGDVYKATHKFDENADYTFDIEFFDYSLNENAPVDYGTSVAPTAFTIDKVKPVVEIEYDDTNATESTTNPGYYTGSRKLIIKVTEHNFNAADLDFTEFIGMNSVGADVETDEINAIIAYFKDPAIWSESGNVHTASYTLEDRDTDANYAIEINYNDLAGNPAVKAESEFCLDNTKPYVVDGAEISYSISIFDTILNAITFGFYNAEMEVTITAYDETAGIDFFTYSYSVSEGGHKDDKGKKDVKISNSDITFTEGGKKATATFKIPEQFRGYVSFTATDMSGNTSDPFNDDKCIVVDNVAPEVIVNYDDYNGIVVDNKYYSTGRTAFIKISADNFFPESLYCEIDDKAGNENHLVITVGKRLENEMSFTYTDVKPTFTKNGDYYEAKVDFDESAEYTFDIKYTDKSHNVFDAYQQDNFTVDKIVPNASIQIGTWSESANGTVWDHFPVDDPATSDVNEDKRSFGPLSTSETVTVTLKNDDTLSYVKAVKYFKSNEILTLDEVRAHTAWIDATANEFTFDVSPDEQFVVYAHVVDAVGNEYYVSSDGVILDHNVPAVEKFAPEIVMEANVQKQPINGIYNTDVDFDVKVVDPTVNGTCSGLMSVVYNVYNVNAAGVRSKTQDGTLFSFDKTTDGALVDTYDEAACITVDSNKNNSNTVVIEVIATDNAGNVKTEEHVIKIDVTAPVIDIAYDNNDVDSATVFDAVRKATITVRERNFKNEDVVMIVTRVDDNGNETKTTVTPNFKVEMDGNAPKVYTFDGEGRDGSEYYVYTMEYTYDKDGDYKFEIEYTDLASNKCVEKNFAQDTVAGTEYEFTLDMTKPVIKVTYNNNNVRNGKYYKATRVATIVITEHNLDPNGVDKDRINITVTATDDGKSITAPVETKWTTKGNTHTATVTYSADALYTFDITVKDKAGNESDDFKTHTFYVDKTNPDLTIEKIVDESANNDEGDIGFVMTATDTNFDVFTPVLTAVVRNGDNFETKQLEIGQMTKIKNGQMFTVTNLEEDGIYRITCTLVDKAGNAYSEVILESSDGAEYVEQRAGEDTLVTFSVNRNGSTFEIDENTADVIDRYYVQNVENDIVIVEVNVDPLKEYVVTLNGKSLVKERDYTVTAEGGAGDWMKYTYKINKDLFAEEGEYKLVVSSRDKAENDAFSDLKEAAIEFVVDRTAPVVTVSGIANDGRYQTDKQTVTLIPTDDGGALKTLIVNMVDEDGKVIKEVINLTGEALTAELEANGGKITFEIAEGLYQNVQIICTDCATTGESDATNTRNMTVKNVSVSSSVFMIFWANKPLRWGTIAGVSAVAIAVIFFIIFKKKKRSKK